jgi:hypothetical protein
MGLYHIGALGDKILLMLGRAYSPSIILQKSNCVKDGSMIKPKS